MYNISEIVKIINTQLNIPVRQFDYSYYNSFISTWQQWYNGKVQNFHTYQDYNGIKTEVIDKVHLNMCKRVCEEHASLTMNENVQIIIDGNNEKEYLLGHDEMTGILGENNFWTLSSSLYEIVCALGTGGIELVLDKIIKTKDKLLVDNNISRLKLVMHDAFDILPISWDNNMKINEVAFLSSTKNGDKEIINLRLHILEKGQYVIYNRKIESQNGNYRLLQVDANDELVERFETHSDIPWYSILKLPIVNNFNLYSPLGLSVFANALDIVKTCDEGFNTLFNEYALGNKKVFYSKELLSHRQNSDGKDVLDVPDRYNKHMFYYTGNEFGHNGDDKQEPIHEFNPDLRIDSIINGLQNSLNYLATSCGLSSNYFKIEYSGIKTATETISENSSMYRNIRKNEIALEKFILDILKACLYVGKTMFNQPLNENVNISIQFDASIIEDKTAIRDRDMKEVQMGIMSIEEYREKWYNTNRRDTVNIKKKEQQSEKQEEQDTKDQTV